MRTIEELHELLDKSIERSVKHEEKMCIWETKMRISERKWRRKERRRWERFEKRMEQLHAKSELRIEQSESRIEQIEAEIVEIEKRSKEQQEVFAAQEAKRKEESAAQEAQIKAELAALDVKIKEESVAQDIKIKAELAALDVKIKEESVAQDIKIKAELAALDVKIKEESVAQDIKIKAELAAQEAQIKAELAAWEIRHKEELAKLEAELVVLRKQSEKAYRKLENLFTGHWGKLIESLVEGDLVNLLREQGVIVNETHCRIKHGTGTEGAEYDIIAVNGNEVVVVEVKTTLMPEDVEYFREKIKEFKHWVPAYKNYKISGAMAFLRQESQSARRAENVGFFVIRATGNSAKIINKPNFQPKYF